MQYGLVNMDNNLNVLSKHVLYETLYLVWAWTSNTFLVCIFETIPMVMKTHCLTSCHPRWWNPPRWSQSNSCFRGWWRCPGSLWRWHGRSTSNIFTSFWCGYLLSSTDQWSRTDQLSVSGARILWDTSFGWKSKILFYKTEWVKIILYHIVYLFPLYWSILAESHGHRATCRSVRKSFTGE